MENQSNTSTPKPQSVIMATASNQRAVIVLNMMMADKTIIDYGFSEDHFCVYDGWFETASGDIYLWETKDRNYNHDHFSDGWMLEVKKKDAMEAARAELDYKGISYINTFKDGIGLVWNLSKMSLDKVVSQTAPRTSAVYGTTITKATVNLLVSKAARKYSII